MSLATEVERLRNKDQTRYDFTDFIMDVQKDFASFFAPQTVKSLIKAQNPMTYNQLDDMLIKALDKLYVSSPTMEWTDTQVKKLNQLTSKLNQVVGRGTPSNRHLFAQYASKINKEINRITEQVDADQKKAHDKYNKELKESEAKRAKNEVSRQLLSDAYYDAKTDPSEDNLATFVKMVEGDLSDSTKVSNSDKGVRQDRTYIPNPLKNSDSPIAKGTDTFLEDVSRLIRGEPTSKQVKYPKGGQN